MKIAIIGSGLAGMTFGSVCAGDHDVTVFEKSRGTSGRMCTRRRVAEGGAQFAFDHGAQYFTIRGDAFKEVLSPLIASGTVAKWDTDMVTISPDGSVSPRVHDAYVACPGMTALARAIGQDLSIEHEVEVNNLTRLDAGWMLHDSNDVTHGPFDLVVSAIPAAQAARLMPDLATHHHFDNVKMMACFTVMMGFDDAINLPWGGAFIEDHPLGFIAVNSTKPGRTGGASLVVQANNQWAEPRIESDPSLIEAEMHAAIKDLIGIDAADAALTSFHRWRYAATQTPLGLSHIYDQATGRIVIGDWCIKGRVEAAFESGYKAAHDMLDMLDKLAT